MDDRQSEDVSVVIEALLRAVRGNLVEIARLYRATGAGAAAGFYEWIVSLIPERDSRVSGSIERSTLAADLMRGPKEMHT